MLLKTKYKLVLAIWFFFGIFFLLCAIISIYFLLILLLLAIGISTYTFIDFRCPNCGKYVFYNPVKIFGIKFNVWTSFIPKQCSKCGTKLL